MIDSASRSLAKTITWRITGSSAVFAISWAFTGNASMASTIALAQLVISTTLYFIHERIWNQINWGRKR
jgi:uncharacterized membrane protein